MDNKNSFAKKLGKGLAYFQAMADELMDLTFKSMKNAAPKEEEGGRVDSSWSGTLKRGVRRTAAFLGEAGDEFYQKYAEIKSKKEKGKTKDIVEG